MSCIMAFTYLECYAVEDCGMRLTRSRHETRNCTYMRYLCRFADSNCSYYYPCIIFIVMTSTERWTALGTICILILVMAAGARAWQKDIAMIDKLLATNEVCLNNVDKLMPMSSPMPNTIMNPAPRCLKYRGGKCRKFERI